MGSWQLNISVPCSQGREIVLSEIGLGMRLPLLTLVPVGILIILTILEASIVLTRVVLVPFFLQFGNLLPQMVNGMLHFCRIIDHMLQIRFEITVKGILRGNLGLDDMGLFLEANFQVLLIFRKLEIFVDEDLLGTVCHFKDSFGVLRREKIELSLVFSFEFSDDVEMLGLSLGRYF